MKTIITYECEGCGKIFENKDKCMHCEASHYPISIADYYYWQALINWYETTCFDDEPTNCNAAIILTKFETEHNLPRTIKE